jgi:23S rRNA (uracil1939-C5)-methyltransferase
VEQVRTDAGRLRAGDHFFDVALLDPPRAGAPGVISQLVLTRPRALVYVSCHAPSLARDLKEASAAGYRIRDLSVFDMFPQTPHCEMLCVLER